MEASEVAIGVCVVYLIATLTMGMLPSLRISKSVTGYVAADRSMNFVVLYFVLGASVFSSFAFLGAPGWAYSRGAAAFYILAYGAFGMVPLYFFGPKARRLGEKFGFVTQAELLAHRFDSRAVSIVMAVVSIGAFIPYLTLQMKGAGYIISTISEGRISAAVGAAVTYGVVMAYVLMSGVLGVGWTNTFQGAFMMLVAWFLGLYLPITLYGGVGSMFEQLAASVHVDMLTVPGLTAGGEPWSWGAFSSAVLVSALGFCIWPHLFMKSYAARSDRVLRLTVVMYPTFQLFLLPILLIGFSGILAYPGVEPADTILPFLLTQLELSPLLVGLVCAGALAASMSSGDSILHAGASIGIRDGWAQLINKPLEDAKEKFLIRVLVVVLSLVAFYYAAFSDASLVELLLAAYGSVAQIFPLVFVAFYWPRATGKGAVAGLLGGLIANMVFLKFPELRPWPDIHEGLYGLAVNLLLLVSVSLSTAPDDPERVKEFTEI